MSSEKLPERIEIGRRVAQALQEHRLSQAAFSRLAGVNQSFVSQVCRGDSLPSVALLRGLHRVGVRIAWVIDGDDAEVLVPAAAAAPVVTGHWADELTPAHLRAYKLVDAAAARRSLDLVEGLLLGLGVEDTRASRSRSA